MNDYKKRIEVESNNLSYLIDKLVDFISQDEYKNLDDENKFLLNMQLETMNKYLHILSVRLKL